MAEYWNAIIIVISVSADAVSHDSSLGTSCLSSYDRKTVYSPEKKSFLSKGDYCTLYLVLANNNLSYDTTSRLRICDGLISKNDYDFSLNFQRNSVFS